MKYIFIFLITLSSCTKDFFHDVEDQWEMGFSDTFVITGNTLYLSIQRDGRPSAQIDLSQFIDDTTIQTYWISSSFPFPTLNNILKSGGSFPLISSKGMRE